MDKPKPINSLTVELIEVRLQNINDEETRAELLTLVNHVIRLDDHCMKEPRTREILLLPVLRSCSSEHDTEQRSALTTLRTIVKHNVQFLDLEDLLPMFDVFEGICTGNADFETARLAMEVVLQLVQGEIELKADENIKQHFITDRWQKVCNLVLSAIEHYSEYATSTYFCDLCCRCIHSFRQLVPVKEFLDFLVPYSVNNIQSDDTGDCTAAVCVLRCVAPLFDHTSPPQLLSLFLPKLEELCTNGSFDDRETAFEAYTYLAKIIGVGVPPNLDNTYMFLCRCLMSAQSGPRRAEYLRSVCTVVNMVVISATEAREVRIAKFPVLVASLLEATNVTDVLHEMPRRAYAAIASCINYMMLPEYHRDFADILLCSLIAKLQRSRDSVSIPSIINDMLKKLGDQQIIRYGVLFLNVVLSMRNQSDFDYSVLTDTLYTLQNHLVELLPVLNPVISAIISDTDHGLVGKVQLIKTLMKLIPSNMLQHYPRLPVSLWEEYLQNRQNVLHDIVLLTIMYGMLDFNQVNLFVLEIRHKIANARQEGSDEDCMKAYLAIVKQLDNTMISSLRDNILGDVTTVLAPSRRNVDVVPTVQELME
jgi:hypothetical protein